MTQQTTPTTTFFDARPHIRLDGAVNEAAANLLVRLEVRQSIVAPATATVTFLNVPEPDDDPLIALSPGRQIDLLVSSEGGIHELFAGTIDGLKYRYEPDAPPQLIVEAIDELARMDGSPRSRVFPEMTDLQAMAAVANLHGLALDVDIESFYPTPDTIVQGQQTDLAFLYERARRAQVFCRFVAGEIQVRQPQTASEGPTLTYGREMMRLMLSASLRDQPTETRVIGWDMLANAPIGESATGVVLGGEGAGLVTASDLLGALGANRPAIVSLSAPLTSIEAQMLATTYYLEAARRYVVGTGEAVGDAALHAGSQVHLAGLAPTLNGRYFVPAAVHRFDGERGYVTRFDVQRAGLTDV